MAVLTVWQNDNKTEIEFEGSRKVSELLTEAGLLIPHPCGGRGVCGKCRIEAEGALSKPDEAEIRAGGRLSCRTIALGNAVIRLREQAEILVEGVEAVQKTADTETETPACGAFQNAAPDKLRGAYTCAVDIGTTTVALRVFEDGQAVFSDGFRNPQSAVAADVMGRIAHEMSARTENHESGDYVSVMMRMIRDMIRERLEKAGLFESIGRYVMTGNTTMLYLLEGMDPTALSAYPFKADQLFDRTGDFFGKPMYLPKCMHAFVGADITCSVLASGMCGNGSDRGERNEEVLREASENAGNAADSANREKIDLLCDVGTNGEIALYKNGKLYVSSTAAGPAFEGAGIECGCQGIPGAIEKVTLEGDELCIKVIGSTAIMHAGDDGTESGIRPAGICGSGLIDAVAALLKREDLDETGYLEDDVTLLGDVYLTQKDIRNVQLAKAAVCAGILTVLEASGTSACDVDTFYIAGGFGSHLNVESAAAIGLFPQELTKKACVIGNAALRGAEMILLSDACREESLRITEMAEHVDLGGSPVFNENYVECMMF